MVAIIIVFVIQGVLAFIFMLTVKPDRALRGGIVVV